MSPRVKAILQSVAQEHGVSVEDITGRCRQPWAAYPRFKAMARLRAVRRANGQHQFSTTKIGVFLGGRDHSTIANGLARAAAIFGPMPASIGYVQDPEETRL